MFERFAFLCIQYLLISSNVFQYKFIKTDFHPILTLPRSYPCDTKILCSDQIILVFIYCLYTILILFNMYCIIVFLKIKCLFLYSQFVLFSFIFRTFVIVLIFFKCIFKF